MKTKCIIILTGFVVLYFTLMLPFENDVQFADQEITSFVWNRDSFWNDLEIKFAEARTINHKLLQERVDSSFVNLNDNLEILITNDVPFNDPIYEDILEKFFNLAYLIAVYHERLNDYIELSSGIRNAVKNQSVRWDMTDRAVKHLTYRILYGVRAAVEEVILQNRNRYSNELLICNETDSKTPFITFEGVRIHSGDILLSRGGTPTSALISRGSDYPGNFSHAALVYIDEETKRVSVIEALIEKGTVISSAEDYMNDHKLRIMVLRLRADHPKILEDPLIAHKIAKDAYDEASSRRISYDFLMDYRNPDKYFCSEVVSAAYGRNGIDLWMKLSTISSKGLKKWLSYFGVRNFTTQEPSDLEYDPQLMVIAEWRGFDVLLKDHIDNAVTDARLEKAEEGAQLQYNRLLLPIARLMKTYSFILNTFGYSGPIPEGMSSVSALKFDKLVDDHEEITSTLNLKFKEFESDNKYTPPYWKLVELARETIRKDGL